MDDYNILIGKTIKSIELIYGGQEIIIHFTDKTALRIEEGDFPYPFYMSMLSKE